MSLNSVHASELLLTTGPIAAGVRKTLLEVAGVKREVTVVDGVIQTVGASSGLASYSVINDGVINILPGGVADWVGVDKSTLNVQDGEVKGGVEIFGGQANINDASVMRSDRAALELIMNVKDPTTLSTAHVSGSTIKGAGYGIMVSAMGEIWLKSTQVEGLGTSASLAGNGGLKLSGGVAHVLEGSHVIGEDSGVNVINGTHGLVSQTNLLEINASTITAQTGSAIEVTRRSETAADKTTADILIADNAKLEAGNGVLIDVNQESTANVKVINSTLSGDLVADDTSTLNVVLRNHGQLNGNIVNGNSVTIDSSGRWQLAADNSVNSLAMDGGSVGFTGDGFHSLSLGKLSGSGLFDMRINLDDGTGDLLSVNGEASGRHRLSVQNTGTEAVPAEFDPLRVVHTESGDAEFGLVGGRADLGVYSYELERQGTDWFIVGSGKEISPSTKSALALFNTAPTVWNSELTTLRSRMGEVRGQEQGGGWMRTYGSRFNAALDSGVDYSQKQQGLSFGADAPVPVGNGQLLFGLMGGYSKSDLDIGRGTSGQVDSYYMGAYGTWLSEGGYYLDGVLKLNQFHNESKVAMSDGTKAKGDYSSKALGGSLEVGKHIKLGDEYFVEPFAQVSSVWINGSSYTLDNGMQARTTQTQSVLGKVGSTVGRSFALKDGGVVKPYTRVAWAHEFSRSNDVSVNGQRFDNDLFGSRAELGAGVSVSLSERLQVHADFDYMKGEHVEQPWGANVGVRLAF
ncbi:autotransporter outer membrane beta-barrel domain-containing protein [Pseudomonas sp. Ps21-P2]|uniref:autotransporter outer membrane beta-barrel domain-containing protein n=1 Tax=Pseudomonas sp. Ps21-P2 TaxID=3080331 RepID=UPI003207EE2E